jgi:hypothetical protein
MLVSAAPPRERIVRERNAEANGRELGTSDELRGAVNERKVAYGGFDSYWL